MKWILKIFCRVYVLFFIKVFFSWVFLKDRLKMDEVMLFVWVVDELEFCGDRNVWVYSSFGFIFW